MPRKVPNKVDQFSKISSLTPVQFQSQVPKLSLDGQFTSAGSLEYKVPNLSKESPDPEKVHCSKHTDDDRNSTGNIASFNWFKNRLEALSGQVRIIFEMQFIWSLRSVEALGIQHGHVMDNGLTFIPGRKGSNGRFIFVPTLINLKSSNRYMANQRIFVISYTAYYNSLKRHGIYFARTGKFKLNCVTHAPRKFNINALKDASGASISELMSYTGHKSISGINYYIGKNSL
jgi:hypothetical protein